MSNRQVRRSQTSGPLNMLIQVWTQSQQPTPLLLVVGRLQGLILCSPLRENFGRAVLHSHGDSGEFVVRTTIAWSLATWSIPSSFHSLKICLLRPAIRHPPATEAPRP
jgi:hypothetical protein